MGETNLQVLLRTMKPILQDGEFVFCVASSQQAQELQPVGQFQEAEGLTIIVRREQADTAQLPYDYVARMITLSVHSSLAAIGFLATITQVLAAHQISVNPVSAYYHDHLFVPVERAAEAMALLNTLATQ